MVNVIISCLESDSMFKWIILATLILMAGAFTGDILLIHHHLDDPLFDSEYSAGMIITCFFILPVVVKNSRVLCFNLFHSHHARKEFLRYFCGWHNSAALTARIPIFYKTRSLTRSGFFIFKK